MRSDPLCPGLGNARSCVPGTTRSPFSTSPDRTDVAKMTPQREAQRERPERPEDEPIGCQRRPPHDVGVREPCGLERRGWDRVISRHGFQRELMVRIVQSGLPA